MNEDLVRLHRAELLDAAERHRLARAVARARRRPSPVVRLYARLWWAGRPRRWTVALFDA